MQFVQTVRNLHQIKMLNKTEESFCKLCLVNIMVEIYFVAYRMGGWKRDIVSW
jgi:hypothetical protein